MPIQRDIPLTISYVLPVYWPAVGGCELHTRELTKRMASKHRIQVINLLNNEKDKQGRELWFACILKAPPDAHEYYDDDIKVIRLPLSSREKILNFPLVRIQSQRLPAAMVDFAMEKLTDFYADKLLPLLNGTNIVHCIHGGVSFLGYAALKTARKLGIPFVYTPVLHLSQPNWYQNMQEKRKNNQPFVYSPDLHLAPRGWTDKYWDLVCSEADVLITMTDFEKEFYLGRGRSSETVNTVGVGPLVSLETNTDIHQKYGLPRQGTVLFLGRNVPSKGIEELLYAASIVWQRHPNVHFIFAGPKDGSADAIFRRYRDNRVHVLGLVSDNEKAALLKSCDIFCMPSREESLGGTFLEAWMFGKPVVGADIPQLRELTENGEGGFFVNPIPEGIAEKLLLLLDDPELGRSMGNWGRERVRAKYSWDLITNKIEQIYYDLIAEHI